MKKFTILLLISITTFCNAQSDYKKAINAQIGYGLSSPYESTDDITDSGFFIQGEYVITYKSWLELKPYIGLITTNSDGKDLNDNPTDEKAVTKAFLIGGKIRVRAPLRWVAPYAEVGIGASVGKFETFTSTIDIEKSGLIYHIPVAFGLELGRNNNFDFGFTYYFQPTVKQFAGAIAIGITFPLKDKKSLSN